jgi:hypothetical protein
MRSVVDRNVVMRRMTTQKDRRSAQKRMVKEEHVGQAEGGNKSNEGNVCKSMDNNIHTRYIYTHTRTYMRPTVL